MVHEILPKGAENAISAAELVRLTGHSSTRHLQNTIAVERERGNLILSTCRNGGGYFMPDDGEKGQAEISEFCNTLYARAINTLKVYSLTRKALETPTGQLQMEVDEFGNI